MKKFSFASLAIFFLAPLLAAAQTVDCATPQFMGGKQIDCKRMGEAGYTPVCDEFYKVNYDSLQAYFNDMSKFCAQFDNSLPGQGPCSKPLAVKNPAGSATPITQKCVQLDTSKLSADGKAKLDALIAQLEKFHKEIDKIRRDLADKAKDAAQKSCSNPDGICRFRFCNGNTCEYRPYDKDPRPGLELLEKKLREPPQASPSDITGVDAQGLLGEQLSLANEMRAYQRELTKEITNLRTKSSMLQTRAVATADRGQKLGPQNPSDITGSQEKPPGDLKKGQETAGQPPQQGGGGSPPGGGGSPSGGGGGEPKDGGAPSSLTDKQNPGGLSGDPTQTADRGGRNSSTQAPEDHPVPKGTLPNNGITDISALTKKKPGESQGSGDPSLVLGPSGKDSDGRNASGGSLNKSSPHFGSVSGGGGGGGGGGGSGGSSNAKGDGPARNPDGSFASAFTGAGGGGGGGGGFGSGGGEDVLSPFGGKQLGDPKFGMNGSETDNSVKDLVGNMAGAEAGSGQGDGRDPASLDGALDGIGSRNSLSLFERTKNYLDRCLQKGCVALTSKTKLGGG